MRTAAGLIAAVSTLVAAPPRDDSASSSVHFMARATSACEQAPRTPDSRGSRYRDAAVAIGADLIDRRGFRSLPGGPDDLLRPRDQSFDLGDGVAGRALFAAALYQATCDTVYWNAAREAFAVVAARIGQPPDTLTGADRFASAVTRYTLYRGTAGPAYALLEADRILGDATYRAAAERGFGELVAAAASAGLGDAWTVNNDVLFGDAGTGLALVAAAEALRDTSYARAARQAAHALLARGRPEAGGLTWRRSEQAEFILPNFSHGAAGIGLFLARAGELTGDSALIGGAVSAARYLLAIVPADSLGFRIPYGWPIPEGGWRRPHDIGWAHGQAGTARLFWHLWVMTGDSVYRRAVDRAADAIHHIPLFGEPPAEYGTEPFDLDMRFGLAGVADFLADLYSATRERRHLELATTIADTIVARAERSNARLRWTTRRHVFMHAPGESGQLTGYLHGASGYGLLFLKLDAVIVGGPPPPRFPDNPW